MNNYFEGSYLIPQEGEKSIREFFKGVLRDAAIASQEGNSVWIHGRIPFGKSNNGIQRQAEHMGYIPVLPNEINNYTQR